MNLTENRDLRGGRSCWTAGSDDSRLSDRWPSAPVNIAIVGAGVMGAMLAERLTASGRTVALFDRRMPGHGSTAASTALVMWAADVPLAQLAERIGAEEAARRWRRVHKAVAALDERIDRLAIACGRAERPELYLAGTLLDETALQAEGMARRAAGLPSVYMTAAAVGDRFGITPRAALLSSGCYALNPVRLTLGLLDIARSRGATAHFPVDIVAIEQQVDGLLLRSADGAAVKAGQVILAPGYERASLFLPPAFSILSSFAIATAPGTATPVREDAMIWEASSPYLYTRSTADGRIIAGGEDEDFEDATRRNALIGAKSGILRAKLAAMLGIDDIVPDCAWAAAFGSSPDGLPAIGRAAFHDRLWIASGFGGNGVSFAALAAELIVAEMAGTTDPDAACFDPYRFA